MLINNTFSSNKTTEIQSMLSNPTSKSNRYSKIQPLYNYLTLDFKQDVSTFGRFRSNKLHQTHRKHQNVFIKTFYNKQSPRMQRKKLVKSSNGRFTSMTNRDSVIGTPFSSLQLIDPEHHNTVFPSLDMQRYRYLLKAIQRISKTKKLAQFGQQTSVSKAKQKIRQNFQSLACDKVQNKISGSPKVVKLQIGFQEHSSPIAKGGCQNVFQKMFKNKQLLQKGRHLAPKGEERENFNFKLLGEDGLLISQMSRQHRKKRPSLAI